MTGTHATNLVHSDGLQPLIKGDKTRISIQVEQRIRKWVTMEKVEGGEKKFEARENETIPRKTCALHRFVHKELRME